LLRRVSNKSRMGTERTASNRALDVRALPTWERHPRIHAAFSSLEGTSSLLLVTDHEPRPLRLEFRRLYPNGFVWSQRHLGVGRWEVVLRKVASDDEADPMSVFLQCCSVLADAREETRRKIARSANVRSLPRGTAIAEQDAQWPYLGFLRTGMLAVVMGSPSGRDQRLFEVMPFETFGAVETLDGGRTMARIVATADADVVLIPRGVVISAMAADFAFASALATICAQRVRAIAELLSAHVTQPAIARVAAALLPYASADAGLSPSLETLQHVTQAQLAATAGTAKEVAARALAELEAAGAIARSGGRIAHMDRTKLQAVIDAPQQD
jgi:CRP-like cAMP-binding protein